MLKHEKKQIAEVVSQHKTSDTTDSNRLNQSIRQPYQHRRSHINRKNKQTGDDQANASTQTLPRVLTARKPLKADKKKIENKFKVENNNVAAIGASVSIDTRLTNRFADIQFPTQLPISARREDIVNALNHHQVVIICGETGSGKSTQVPKICLAMGRGQGKGLIGHTQPRRIAASTIARRLAEELDSTLGHVVGYKVRFKDTLLASASIKLMTDGILLAETQSDPLLRAYDTIIIDEAHERSLNIDFLLGYLKLLLPRRPDLKIIVMSATIDADRFVKYFYPTKENNNCEKIISLPNENNPIENSAHLKTICENSIYNVAPVIEASGRLYDVEIRYRPIAYENLLQPNTIKKESNCLDDANINNNCLGRSTINKAIATNKGNASRPDLFDVLISAVSELIKEGPGDILVFFAGEKEIRDAVDVLKQPFAEQIEILTLYSRLSVKEQLKVFSSSNKRRIVLATNVAETSLTVPGIRFVIDIGNARVKRYSYRNKVEQLRIEPISQAAVRQRTGRCGRVAAGICIRLYEENDFEQRPAYTDPEILRSSLTAVILRMKALSLPDISCFPFLDMPSSRAIADGYQLLNELGAVDSTKALTSTGYKLTKIPLDPRIGRMILAANEENALSEVLIIAAALSIQDPRERPFEQAAAADAAHRSFIDKHSEFMFWIHAWKWMQEKMEMKPTRREWQNSCNRQFLSVTRLREWREIYIQLQTIVRQQQWYINSEGANYEQIHRALLTGLLGNIGLKSADEKHYLGARGIKFFPWPASIFAKNSPAWLVAAELIETKRLYGRMLAKIEPAWIEKVGAHLIRRSRYEPHWEKRSGNVVAFEQATLHGLTLYQRRKISYGKLVEEQSTAREIFIRQALVMGCCLNKKPFLMHNEELIANVEKIEHQLRKQNILADEEIIFSFYDQYIPKDIIDTKSFDKWYQQASRENKNLLMLSAEMLLEDSSQLINETAYPTYLLEAGQILTLSYYFDPTSTFDGITINIPLFVLNQISSKRFEWLVPGMLQAKVYAFLKSLPNRFRSYCVPLTHYAEQFIARRIKDDLNPDCKITRHFLPALIADIREHTSLKINESDFQIEIIDKHHFMNFRIIDEQNNVLAMDRDFSTLQAQFAETARQKFQSIMQIALQSSLNTEKKKPFENNFRVDVPTKQIYRKDFFVSNANKKEGDSQINFAASQVEPEIKVPEQLFFEQTTFNRHHLHSSPVKNIINWSFGLLPKCITLVDQGSKLYGFPALIDNVKDCAIKIFDSIEEAQLAHWQGLRRLFIIGLSQTTKNFEKKILNWNSLSFSYLFLKQASSHLLKDQIVARVVERCCMIEPLPQDKNQFLARIEAAKTKFVINSQNLVAELHNIFTRYNQALEQLDLIQHNELSYRDISNQLSALVHVHFIIETPDIYLKHINRYLEGIIIRISKLKADGQRDKRLMLEIMPIKQLLERYQNAKDGISIDQVQSFRWLFEELRISLFAQELKTPMPMSVKRFYKLWQAKQT